MGVSLRALGVFLVLERWKIVTNLVYGQYNSGSVGSHYFIFSANKHSDLMVNLAFMLFLF